eukprot:5032337-Amphidinium_carterae.1
MGCCGSSHTQNNSAATGAQDLLCKCGPRRLRSCGTQHKGGVASIGVRRVKDQGRHGPTSHPSNQAGWPYRLPCSLEVPVQAVRSNSSLASFNSMKGTALPGDLRPDVVDTRHHILKLTHSLDTIRRHPADFHDMVLITRAERWDICTSVEDAWDQPDYCHSFV